MNYGLCFLRIFKSIYANTEASIHINRLTSDQIHLQRGTRQGWPLSPILFALGMEPLAIAISANLSI